jgi:hypothetical protein
VKKITIQEQKRLREHAVLTLRLSQDTRPEVLRKDCAHFSKDLLNAILRKRQIKNWLVVLIETDGGDKS